MKYLCICVCTLLCLTSYSQEDSVQVMPGADLSRISAKHLGQLDKKNTSLRESVSKKTIKALRRMAKEEEKIAAYITKKDSAAGKEIFSNVRKRYNELINAAASKTAKLPDGLPTNYIPKLDTLENSLKFLFDKIEGTTGPLKEKLAGSIAGFDAVKGKLQQADEVMEFIKLRKQLLKETLAKDPDLPGRIVKSFKNINKEAYYYGEQLLQMRSALNEPGKLEEMLIGIAKKIPAFSSFFERNSQLAGFFAPGSSARLFPAPSSGTSFVSGLQPRSLVQQLVQTRVGSATNVNQLMQQQIAQGLQQAEKLKEKLKRGFVDEGEFGSFKPNSQRTKSFWQRIEYSTDLQFGRPVNFLPATSDIALQIGYKLNDKSSIGIGTAYKLGLGEGWNRIRFSQQGIGFRSFINWRLKGNFYVQGNAELNYMSQFRNYAQLRQFNDWQRAAMLGISKKYRISKKIKGNFQVLYDFLHKTHVPNTQGFIIRTGYSF